MLPVLLPGILGLVYKIFISQVVLHWQKTPTQRTMDTTSSTLELVSFIGGSTVYCRPGWAKSCDRYFKRRRLQDVNTCLFLNPCSPMNSSFCTMNLSPNSPLYQAPRQIHSGLEGSSSCWYLYYCSKTIISNFCFLLNVLCTQTLYRWHLFCITLGLMKICGMVVVIIILCNWGFRSSRFFITAVLLLLKNRLGLGPGVNNTWCYVP